MKIIKDKLTKNEVIKSVGVSPSTLYRIVKKGFLTKNEDGTYSKKNLIEVFGPDLKYNKNNSPLSNTKKVIPNKKLAPKKSSVSISQKPLLERRIKEMEDRINVLEAKSSTNKSNNLFSTMLDFTKNILDNTNIEHIVGDDYCSLPHKIFKKRLNENIKTLRKQLKKNKFCASDYHYMNQDKKYNDVFANRRFDDILAATVIGALPVNSTNGVDCYRLKNGVYEAVEVKLAAVHDRGLFKSKNDALYVGKVPTNESNKRNSIRSQWKASYTIHTKKNLHTKNMATVLVLIEEKTNSVLDAFEINGDVVVDYLTGKQTNSRSNSATTNKNIKLSAFINHGERCDSTIDITGYENWEIRQKKRTDLPVV